MGSNLMPLPMLRTASRAALNSIPAKLRIGISGHPLPGS